MADGIRGTYGGYRVVWALHKEQSGDRTRRLMPPFAVKVQRCDRDTDAIDDDVGEYAATLGDKGLVPFIGSGIENT